MAQSALKLALVMTAIPLSQCIGAGMVRAAGTPASLISRCVNIANDLESPTEGEWGRPVTQQDLTIIAAAGFDTVRLPVSWSTHAAMTAPYAVDPVFMKRVETVIDQALAAKLRVIVNDHNYTALFTDPAGESARLAGIWRQVAAALASRPRSRVWFEIENEPHGQLTNANLLATLRPALAAIRATNPDRPVVIGGEGWSNIDSLPTLELPADANVVPTFHYYLPFAFTHQGAGWVKPTPPLGASYGSAADQAALAVDVEKIRRYVARTGKVPLMGEFGAYETAPLAQRVAYYGAVSSAFDAVHTGACAWAYTNSFPLYDDRARAWLPGMLKALGLPK